MMKKFLWLFAAACLVACPKVASAGETDLLIQKLVDKGVLTGNEAQILTDEIKQDVTKQNSKGMNDMLPQWIQTIKIKGDTRLRFEAVKDKQATPSNDTVYGYSKSKYLTHERLRVRLGLEAKVNDQMQVGIGIATGAANDPRSRNVTLGADNSYSRNTTYTGTGATAGKNYGTDYTPGSGKNIVLDYAYAKYTPISWATITGGKFQNPMWSPWDMVWKGDITPEGAAVQINYPVNGDLSLFFNNLDFALRDPDVAGSKNLGMYGFQPGFVWSITPSISLKSAVAYYQFENLRGNPKFSYSQGGNRLDAGGNYLDNHNSIQPNAEIGFKNPFGETMGQYLPYASIFGDYIRDLSSKNGTSSISGYDGGVKFGYEKVADWKQWQARGAVSKMGKDAWVDAFTDSDRYQKGKTDTISYEGILEFGLGKNSSLVLDYYYSQLLLPTYSGTTNLGRLPESVVQLDWNLKF